MPVNGILIATRATARAPVDGLARAITERLSVRISCRGDGTVAVACATGAQTTRTVAAAAMRRTGSNASPNIGHRTEVADDSPVAHTRPSVASADALARG